MRGEPRFRGRRGCRLITEVDGVAICEQLCVEDRASWVGPGYRRDYVLTMQRAGGFRCRADGHEHFLDPTVVNFEWPGEEFSVAHPLGPCAPATLIVLPPELGAGELSDRMASEAPRTGPVELAHWALVTACRRGVDRFEVAERLWGLLDLLPRPQEPVRVAGRRPPTALAHRRLVDAAREVLSSGDFSLSLDAIARRVGCSAAHLSRVFRQTAGCSLTSYRNDLRMRAVLRDIADGAPSLRILAATYGFADQAHLTRVARARLGLPPSRVRALLDPA
ncbi:AraC family transcriptional regulator [Actinophytocola sp.]|uniref:helix-turn-helix transcriptional regulator n=1 Tax=Actinophytocola sp. TaxID=1872138 RepID=UPI002D7EC864|nr:AraC family transcriptional regulator [Actinophytocola sp.]HET9141154.1 AraC family transcriptional regulator [Actinophytocola sp.]